MEEARTSRHTFGALGVAQQGNPTPIRSLQIGRFGVGASRREAPKTYVNSPLGKSCAHEAPKKCALRCVTSGTGLCSVPQSVGRFMGGSVTDRLRARPKGAAQLT